MEEILSSSKDQRSSIKISEKKDTPVSVTMNINEEFELKDISIKPKLKDPKDLLQKNEDYINKLTDKTFSEMVLK